MQWFRSYLSEQIFFVNIESKLIEFRKMSSGLPQGSTLGPLLLLIYVNYMPQVVKPTLVLYADGSCILINTRK